MLSWLIIPTAYQHTAQKKPASPLRGAKWYAGMLVCSRAPAPAILVFVRLSTLALGPPLSIPAYQKRNNPLKPNELKVVCSAGLSYHQHTSIPHKKTPHPPCGVRGAGCVCAHPQTSTGRYLTPSRPLSGFVVSSRTLPTEVRNTLPRYPRSNRENLTFAPRVIS